MNTPTPNTLDALLARQGSVTFTAEQVALLREAVRIADDYTRSTIECMGIDVTVDGAQWWQLHGLRDAQCVDHATLAEAVTYLTQRGRINRHPTSPITVNFHGHDPVSP